MGSYPSPRDRKLLSYHPRVTRCSAPLWVLVRSRKRSAVGGIGRIRRPTELVPPQGAPNPDPGSRCRHNEHTPHRRLQPKLAQEAAERGKGAGHRLPDVQFGPSDSAVTSGRKKPALRGAWASWFSSLKLTARESDAVGFARPQFRGWLICACAAARRATGTRYGEQLT